MIYGVGINDADYVVRPIINGKEVRCPFYQTWNNMLQRCYYEPYLQRHPTYKDCKVCDQWKHFSDFKFWMETQDWKGNQLDKDFLGGGKLYSPETCCFAEQWLNKLFADRTNDRGKWPLGVYWHKRDQKFIARLRTGNGVKNLGYFDDPEEAHRAYRTAKLNTSKPL